jgi:hypothetical protein
VILVVLCLAAVTLSAAELDEPHRCGFLNLAERAAIRRSAPGILRLEERPTLPFYVDSPSGRFRVHYALEGTDAVPVADGNGDGVPNYVDSALFALESAWSSFITEQGYAPPPADGMAGGSSAIDVYLLDLSKAGASGLGMYGQSVPDSSFKVGPVDRCTSWMEIDNDFDSTDRNALGKPVFSTYGTSALRVTITHEFHHVIQIGCYALAYEQLSFYELTSTWMEMRVAPDVRDYEQYLRSLLNAPDRYPFSSPRSQYGYSWAWWGEYLASNHGDSVVLNSWERIGTGVRPFAAHADAVASTGTTIDVAMCDAIEWLYYTGDRAKTTAYLPYATELPPMHLEYEGFVDEPGLTLTTSLLPLEGRCYQFLIPTAQTGGSVSVQFATVNMDVQSYVNATEQRRVCTVRVSSTQQPNWTAVPGTTWSWTVDGACVHTFESSAAVLSERAYPQPFDRATMSTLYLPMPPTLLGVTATVTTYRSDMVAVRQDQVVAVLDGQRVSLPWEQAQALDRGVYLIMVEADGHSELMKVMVK